MTGLISLVGAGPGDPELMTLKGVRRLGDADLVLYDALVNPAVLDFAPRARRFFVGKRAGRPGIGQAAINALMIRWGRRGKHVVRLKCGDPFIFGRGGEEIAALASAGIPTEVIPGLSAATTAPLLAGIPLTHRGAASAFVVVSGHDDSAYGCLFDNLPPDSATLVILMGNANRAAIAERLITRGWSAASPAAILSGMSSDGAEVWVGDLGSMGEGALAGIDRNLPATIVVGRVVSLRHAGLGEASTAGEREVRDVSAG